MSDSSVSHFIAVSSVEVEVGPTNATVRPKRLNRKKASKNHDLSDFEYNVTSSGSDHEVGKDKEKSNAVTTEDLPIGYKLPAESENLPVTPKRTRNKLKSYVESDDELDFGNISDKSPSRQGKKRSKYQDDDEYNPEPDKNNLGDNEDEDDQTCNLSPRKKTLKKRGRKPRSSKSESATEPSPLKGKQVDAIKVTNIQSNPINTNPDSDIENNLSTCVIQASNPKFNQSRKDVAGIAQSTKVVRMVVGETTVSKIVPTSEMGKVFEQFCLEQNDNCSPIKTQITKRNGHQPKLNIKPKVENQKKPLVFPGLKVEDKHEVPMSNVIGKRVKTCVNFSPDQKDKACNFVKDILKTTSDLGDLIGEKANEFLTKKVNQENIKDTIRLDYCVDKAFLLFKLAKDNLNTMEESLKQQYVNFMKENSLSYTFEHNRESKANIQAVDSDSDCEIVGVCPSAVSRLSSEISVSFQSNKNAKKICFNSASNNTASTSKPQNTVINRHAVWINNTSMVRQVPKNGDNKQDPFLGQDSLKLKPPDKINQDLTIWQKHFLEIDSCNMKPTYNYDISCYPVTICSCKGNFKRCERHRNGTVSNNCFNHGQMDNPMNTSFQNSVSLRCSLRNLDWLDLSINDSVIKPNLQSLYSKPSKFRRSLSSVRSDDTEDDGFWESEIEDDISVQGDLVSVDCMKDSMNLKFNVDSWTFTNHAQNPKSLLRIVLDNLQNYIFNPNTAITTKNYNVNMRMNNGFQEQFDIDNWIYPQNCLTSPESLFRITLKVLNNSIIARKTNITLLNATLKPELKSPVILDKSVEPKTLSELSLKVIQNIEENLVKGNLTYDSPKSLSHLAMSALPEFENCDGVSGNNQEVKFKYYNPKSLSHLVISTMVFIEDNQTSACIYRVKSLREMSLNIINSMSTAELHKLNKELRRFCEFNKPKMLKELVIDFINKNNFISSIILDKSIPTTSVDELPPVPQAQFHEKLLFKNSVGKCMSETVNSIVQIEANYEDFSESSGSLQGDYLDNFEIWLNSDELSTEGNKRFVNEITPCKVNEEDLCDNITTKNKKELLSNITNNTYYNDECSGLPLLGLKKKENKKGKKQNNSKTSIPKSLHNDNGLQIKIGSVTGNVPYTMREDATNSCYEIGRDDSNSLYENNCNDRLYNLDNVIVKLEANHELTDDFLNDDDVIEEGLLPAFVPVKSEPGFHYAADIKDEEMETNPKMETSENYLPMTKVETVLGNENPFVTLNENRQDTINRLVTSQCEMDSRDSTENLICMPIVHIKMEGTNSEIVRSTLETGDFDDLLEIRTTQEITLASETDEFLQVRGRNVATSVGEKNLLNSEDIRGTRLSSKEQIVPLNDKNNKKAKKKTVLKKIANIESPNKTTSSVRGDSTAVVIAPEPPEPDSPRYQFPDQDSAESEGISDNDNSPRYGFPDQAVETLHHSDDGSPVKHLLLNQLSDKTKSRKKTVVGNKVNHLVESSHHSDVGSSVRYLFPDQLSDHETTSPEKPSVEKSSRKSAKLQFNFNFSKLLVKENDKKTKEKFSDKTQILKSSEEENAGNIDDVTEKSKVRKNNLTEQDLHNIQESSINQFIKQELELDLNENSQDSAIENNSKYVSEAEEVDHFGSNDHMFDNDPDQLLSNVTPIINEDENLQSHKDLRGILYDLLKSSSEDETQKESEKMIKKVSRRKREKRNSKVWSKLRSKYGDLVVDKCGWITFAVKPNDVKLFTPCSVMVNKIPDIILEMYRGYLDERAEERDIERLLNFSTLQARNREDSSDNADILCDPAYDDAVITDPAFMVMGKPKKSKRQKAPCRVKDEIRNLRLDNESETDSEIEMLMQKQRAAIIKQLDAEEILKRNMEAKQYLMQSSSDDAENSATKRKKHKRKSKRQDEIDMGDSKLDRLKGKENKRWVNNTLLSGRLSETDSEEEERRWLKRKERERLGLDCSQDLSKRSSGRRKRKRAIRIGADIEVYSSDDDQPLGNGTQGNTDTLEKILKRGKKGQDVSKLEDTTKDIKPQIDQKSPKGRRNIRKMIDKNSLAESTKEALRNEEERKHRLFARNKIRDAPSDSKEIVLDIDTASKQPLLTIHPGWKNLLKEHQMEGLKFMWDACFESMDRAQSGDKGGGCILAHCMGLGKTLQVIALFHTVLAQRSLGIRCILVCCPLSTVLNWVDELNKWLEAIGEAKSIKVFELSKLKKNYERGFQLEDWHKEGGVFVIGYEMFRHLTSMTPEKDKVRPVIIQKITTTLLNPGPDLVVCDEGHLLKNEKSHLARMMNRIATNRRIALTGTPLQNNLREYYCMVNFVKPNLLGTYREYFNRFENPITNGQHRDSSSYDIRIMKHRSHVLHKMLECVLQRKEVSILYPYLPKKHEYVLLISLTDCQVNLYQFYLMYHSSRNVIKKSILKDYHNLQRIWTHPRVMHYFYQKTLESHSKKTTKSGIKLELKEEIGLEDELAKQDAMAREAEEMGEDNSWWMQFLAEGEIDQIELSNKFSTAFNIIDECVSIGDKVLLFSMSLYTLDALEYFLRKIKNWSVGTQYYRLDGSVPLENRQKWCREFNNEKNTEAKLFLISTRAGGLGINMIAANRVIIMDASWNPSHDMQSIFRVYRFGQTKECFIYRLIAMGTMEEKIYERSVTKQAIALRVVDEQQIDRHYNMAELNELYNFTIPEPPSEKDLESLPVPSDPLLARLLVQRMGRGTGALRSYHEHDSLLRHVLHEGLDEDEQKKAWDDYKAEQAAKEAAQAAIAQRMANAAAANSYQNMSEFSRYLASLTNNQTSLPPILLPMLQGHISHLSGASTSLVPNQLAHLPGSSTSTNHPSPAANSMLKNMLSSQVMLPMNSSKRFLPEPTPYRMPETIDMGNLDALRKSIVPLVPLNIFAKVYRQIRIAEPELSSEAVLLEVGRLLSAWDPSMHHNDISDKATPTSLPTSNKPVSKSPKKRGRPKKTAKTQPKVPEAVEPAPLLDTQPLFNDEEESVLSDLGLPRLTMYTDTLNLEPPIPVEMEDPVVTILPLHDSDLENDHLLPHSPDVDSDPTYSPTIRHGKVKRRTPKKNKKREAHFRQHTPQHLMPPEDLCILGSETPVLAEPQLIEPMGAYQSTFDKSTDEIIEID